MGMTIHDNDVDEKYSTIDVDMPFDAYRLVAHKNFRHDATIHKWKAFETRVVARSNSRLWRMLSKIGIQSYTTKEANRVIGECMVNDIVLDALVAEINRQEIKFKQFTPKEGDTTGTFKERSLEEISKRAEDFGNRCRVKRDNA